MKGINVLTRNVFATNKSVKVYFVLAAPLRCVGRLRRHRSTPSVDTPYNRPLLGPNHVEHAGPRPITEVEQRRAWLVLRWVTVVTSPQPWRGLK